MTPFAKFKVALIPSYPFFEHVINDYKRLEFGDIASVAHYVNVKGGVISDGKVIKT